MHWQDILAIVVPLFALITWVYTRTEKKADERYRELKEEMKELRSEDKDLRSILISIKDRLTRLEGRFDERGYWESRRTGTHDHDEER
jgi:F0F1-type ATP synthase membrane subunit b/b'